METTLAEFNLYLYFSFYTMFLENNLKLKNLNIFWQQFMFRFLLTDI